MVYLPQTSWTSESQVIDIEFKSKHIPDLSWFHIGFWKELSDLTWPTRSYVLQVIKRLDVMLMCPLSQQRDEQELNTHPTGRGKKVGIRDSLLCTAFVWPRLPCICGPVRPAAKFTSLTWVGTPVRHGVLMWVTCILVSLIYSRVTYGLAICWVLILPAHPHVSLLIVLFRSCLLLL